MRTLDKILIVLFTVTVALGIVILMYSGDNDESFQHFRSLLFKDPAQLVAEGTLTFGNFSGLWYGGMSMFAILMIGVALKAVRGGELQAFRDRLVTAEVSKAEVETSLQDWIWKEKHARAAREAALKDLEAGVNRILSLEDQLTEKERLLQSRDSQLKALRSQLNALPERGSERGSAAVQDSAVRDELRKKTELLQAKDSAMKEIEKNLTGQLRALETQVGVKETLLAERAKELEALKAQLARTGIAKTQAETLMAEELRKERQALQAKDSAVKDLEKKLTGTLRTLEAELSEKEGLLQSRSIELETLRSELKSTTGRLADLESSKQRAEDALQRELKKTTEALHDKDAALRKLQATFSKTVQTFEGQLNDRDKLLQDRDADLGALRSEMNKLASVGSAKKQAENVLQQNLRQHMEALQAKDAAMKDLEKNLSAKISALQADVNEKDELLQTRSVELEALTSDVDILRGRMADVASVKEQLETLLQQELEKKTKILQSKDSAFKELQTNLSAKVHDLETQLGAKNAFLNQRNAELDALTAQLTKMGSSKKEVEALLRQELAKMTELLEAKDATIGELEESLNRAVEGLRNRLREQETLLKSRDETIEVLRSEIVGLKSPPAKPASDMLPMEVLTEGPAKAIAKQPDKNLERVQKLETLLNEKEDLVKVHQGKIERLESELKEKRTELARREIAVWQAIERREIWKRRLARFGIPVKD